MLICGTSLSPYCGYFPSVRGFQSESNWHIKNTRSIISCKSHSESVKSFSLATFLTSVAVIASIATADATNYEQEETLSNIPQTLSGECRSAQDCKKAKIQKPKSRTAESCTIKCVTTCIRGGDGSPGEGPLNVRRYM